MTVTAGRDGKGWFRRRGGTAGVGFHDGTGRDRAGSGNGYPEDGIVDGTGDHGQDHFENGFMVPFLCYRHHSLPSRQDTVTNKPWCFVDCGVLVVYPKGQSSSEDDSAGRSPLGTIVPNNDGKFEILPRAICPSPFRNGWAAPGPGRAIARASCVTHGSVESGLYTLISTSWEFGLRKQDTPLQHI